MSFRTCFGISCGNTLFELLLSPFANTSESTFLRKFHYFCIRFRYFLRKYVVRAIALTFREYVGIDFLTKVLWFLYSLSVFPTEIRCSSYCSHLLRIRRNWLSYESFIIFVFAFGISCGNTLFELLLSPFANTSELTFLRKSIPWINTF